MQNDAATNLCTLLLTHRVVSRAKFPELEDDPTVLEEVRARLARVGMTLIERTGIPFLGVVVRDEYVTEEVSNELGLDQRALALIFRVWLILVAPCVYIRYAPPADLHSVTVTETALFLALQDTWEKTTLRRYLSVLQRAKFLEKIPKQPQPTYAAGPLLWLAIDHDALIQNLKRSAIPFTIARLHQEAERKLEEEDSEEEP